MPETLEWWRWVSLLVILGGLFGLWYYLNRSNLKLKNLLQKKESRITIVERAWVDNRTTVSIINVDGVEYIFAQNPSGLVWQKLEHSDRMKQTTKTHSP
jgi:hypothetical protein